MSRAKTGALIVVGQLDSLAEYERTGIAVDGIVTSQLLINIFEKNTPLHDGAVIVPVSYTHLDVYKRQHQDGGLSDRYRTRGRHARWNGHRKGNAGGGCEESCIVYRILCKEDAEKLNFSESPFQYRGFTL